MPSGSRCENSGGPSCPARPFGADIMRKAHDDPLVEADPADPLTPSQGDRPGLDPADEVCGLAQLLVLDDMGLVQGGDEGRCRGNRGNDNHQAIAQAIKQ